MNGPLGLGKENEKVESRRTCGDHANNKIGLNTEKSPGDLKRLAVTQTPMKDNHQMLV